MQAFTSILASIVASVVACGLSACVRTKPDTATEMSQPSGTGTSAVSKCAGARARAVACNDAPGSASPLEPAPIVSPIEKQPAVDFATQVRPILESRCQPCHFTGGVMYERRPFDRPETIHALGEKLFTRIKDENEQRVIREFLLQGEK